ncbi:MAG: hypothetical protein VYB17_02270 [Candidatus Thermoplasmatota archaeon]|nr:hypothetical protein [Candidatus Thermoplasmatota archaeon]
MNDELSSPDSRRELNLSPATFSADSLESMAGITAAELAASPNEEISSLLGDEVEQPQVDMSAIGQTQPTKESRTDVEIPDDLLDFD